MELERVPDETDCLIFKGYSHHVETAVNPQVQPFFLNVCERESTELSLLPSAYCLLRRAEAAGAAGLHLDEDQRLVVAGDYVDLTPPESEIPLDYLISLLLEKPHREILTIPPNLDSLIHHENMRRRFT